ncbi:MAG: HAMP domain-containing histidine kinase [Bacillota bacterium]|nr:HAMP domain-containing histidine kinase [Bacillota bacterium]
MGSRLQIHKVKINIYKKMGAVLLLSFIIQAVLLIVFYRNIFTDRLVREINGQEDNRSAILQMVSNILLDSSISKEEAWSKIDDVSSAYKAGFTIKDSSGNTVYFSQESFSGGSIQSQEYVKENDKISYLIYGYFPALIEGMSMDNKEVTMSMILIGGLLTISFMSLYIIYRLIAKPIKSLSKAARELNYGKTEISIPYHSQDEIGELSRTFEEMGMRLKLSEDNQKEMIGAISHDIKTPLTSIMGYSKRLKDGKVKDEKKEEYYNIIWKKAADIENLLAELDDYGILNSKSSYNFKQVSAEEIFSLIVKEIGRDLEEKNIRFNVVNKLTEGSLIKIDEVNIKRVFYNIVYNSLKYGGKNVEISAAAEEMENFIRFSISDNGNGVLDQNLDKIFARFFREEESRNREKGGTGLGLSICREVIESHGGKIHGENNHPGLSIIFTLPKVNKN